MSVDGEQVAAGLVPVSAPPLFSANDCLDIGTCLGGPVSLDYYDRAPSRSTVRSATSTSDTPHSHGLVTAPAAYSNVRAAADRPRHTTLEEGDPPWEFCVDDEATKMSGVSR
jgi:hypothetical protein